MTMRGLVRDAEPDRQPSRPRGIVRGLKNTPHLLGIFAPWRLHAYGYTLAALYAFCLLLFYVWGFWPVDRAGTPILDDFTMFWIGGTQALHGNAAALYDPAQFAKLQAAAVGPREADAFVYPSFSYPPIFLLIMAPFGLLPCLPAFLTFETVTLLAFVAVVFFIVRRPPAVALALAAPFTPINFLHGQTGFLRASLVGAALLALERRPLLDGVFIGCLTYKPQFGILFPVALLAAKQWRAIAAATIAAAVLAGLSVSAFGIGPWEAFPRELIHATDVLTLERPNFTDWTYHQTVYGGVRYLHGNEATAWFIQGCAAVAAAAVVWLVWRSPAPYALKAATLSAATLIASPWEWITDMTVLAISIAFLARDQISSGLLRGEQSIMIALFGAALVMLFGIGSPPLGPVMVIILLGVVLRRIYRDVPTRDAAFSR
jgi:arabinofuranan 3-O-arabinosyltransferase